MKRKLLTVFMIISLCISLTACSSGEPVKASDSKEREYIRAYDLKGISFSMPRVLYNKAEPMKEMVQRSVEENKSHVYKDFNDKEYMLYQPDYIFLYAMFIGKTDLKNNPPEISEISDVLHVGSIIEFEEGKHESPVLTNENGITKIKYSVKFTETFLGEDFSYDGYVVLIGNDETRESYCLTIGYKGKDYDSISDSIADSLKLHSNGNNVDYQKDQAALGPVKPVSPAYR